MDVFINDLSVFMPNEPVDNENIENVLGKVSHISSRVKNIILKNNQIKSRYYAINPETGIITHSNAQMAFLAIQKLKPYSDFKLHDIELLAAGTTTADLIAPGYALMILGLLKISPCEAVTTSGICVSGMTALKYAYMNVALGFKSNAVSVASELSSSFLRSKFYSQNSNYDEINLEKNPVLAFEAEFLRWMLSDGAGAMFISNKPCSSGLSLKIDWIEIMSFAGEHETCMYAGGVKDSEGNIIGWREKELIQSYNNEYVMTVKQDVKLLEKSIVTTMEQTLLKLIKKYDLSPAQFDYFVPHYSSGYFKDKFYQGMKNVAFEIPYDRWFTNLETKGNTGSASIYIILEELFKSGKLRKNDRLLCFIPESGRFSHSFMQLTVI
ncbi:MAG: hypothetical protein ACD_79C00864G0004 [uncultured bacterium]|nr:MAG: hypothetical protein ACD_79C00864G0004 [uncultured bacterium]